MNELVSVIVPAYNVDKYLKRCIYSLVNQTYKNIEIIIVDDGSTDETSLLCDEFKNNYSEIIKVIHKKNGGLSSARNIGIKASSGEYITFVDSDDWVERDYISTLLNQFSSNDIDISCVAFDYAYDDHFQKYEYKMKDRVMTRFESLTTLCIGKTLTNHVWNKMYRSYLFSDVCFEEGRTYEDIIVMHQLFSKAKKVSMVNKTMHHYYIRSDSISHEPKPQSTADMAVAFIQTFYFLKNPIHRYFTIKKCAWSSFQVIFLINKENVLKNDIKTVLSFWKKHRCIALLGKKYFLMYKKPYYYRRIISKDKRG